MRTPWTAGVPLGRRVAASLGWLLVAVAVLALVLHQFGTGNQQLIIIASFAPYLMAAGLLAIPCFAVGRDVVGGAVAIAVSILALASQLPLYLPTGGSGRASLVVLQANLRLGHADAAHLVGEVRADQVDVLTTVELSPAELERLIAAGLGRELPYRYGQVKTGAQGVAIWSRYPVTDGRDYAQYELGMVSAEVQVPQETITVVAVHVVPPWPGPPSAWRDELVELRGDLARLGDGPVVVGGDFNATPDHAQFRAVLQHGYSDAVADSGGGYLATYPGDRWYPSLLAIDHVLLRDAGAVSARTVSLPGSDHRGLLVGVRLTGRR